MWNDFKAFTFWMVEMLMKNVNNQCENVNNYVWLKFPCEI